MPATARELDDRKYVCCSQASQLQLARMATALKLTFFATWSHYTVMLYCRGPKRCIVEMSQSKIVPIVISFYKAKFYSFERWKSLYSPDVKTRSWQPNKPPPWGSFCNANFSKETKRLVLSRFAFVLEVCLNVCDYVTLEKVPLDPRPPCYF